MMLISTDRDAMVFGGSSSYLSFLTKLVLTVVLFLVPSVLYAIAPGEVLEYSLDRVYQTDELLNEIAPLFEGFDPPPPEYAVEVYWVRYLSTYLDGKPIKINAQLFIPRLARGRKVPVYVFAPGSTGLIDACRVSREHIAGIRWGLYRSHVLAHAGQGAIGVLPDYMGFGEPDILQPFFSATAGGRVMLDAVRSVKDFTRRNKTSAEPDTVFLAGFSQGGHAAFAGADLRNSYARELKINGIIGYGPTTDMQALFREFSVVAPMVVYTYSKLYGVDRFNPADILNQKWLENLEYDVTRQCIGAMQQYYPWTPEEMFNNKFAEALINNRLEEEFPSIASVLNANSTGLSGHSIPVLILQGTEDPVVYPETQLGFTDELYRRNSPVRIIIYKGNRHDTRQIGFYEVVQWMRRVSMYKPPLKYEIIEK